MPTATRDFYEILGVDQSASEDEIRRAYRKLARRYHPDVNKDGGAEERFKEISEAYEVLSDASSRERYDRSSMGWPQAGADGDFRVEFADGDFGAILESLLRGGRGAAGTNGFGGAGFAMRGSDLESALDMTLEDAAIGGRRTVGLADGRTYEIDVPVGVRDGQRIRLAGEGGAGSGGAPAGDLFLRVRILPDPRFRLDGRDLHVDLPVTPWEAALGATVDVPTLDGEAKVRVPPGSSSGRRLRLRGRGFPDPGGPGDLYATLTIAVPRTLTDRERALFEQLARESSFDPREGLR